MRGLKVYKLNLTNWLLLRCRCFVQMMRDEDSEDDSDDRSRVETTKPSTRRGEVSLGRCVG
jgi:hypothetical protein